LTVFVCCSRQYRRRARFACRDQSQISRSSSALRPPDVLRLRQACSATATTSSAAPDAASPCLRASPSPSASTAPRTFVFSLDSASFLPIYPPSNFQLPCYTLLLSLLPLRGENTHAPTHPTHKILLFSAGTRPPSPRKEELARQHDDEPKPTPAMTATTRQAARALFPPSAWSPSTTDDEREDDPPPAYNTFVRHIGTQMPLSRSCATGRRGVVNEPLPRAISDLELQTSVLDYEDWAADGSGWSGARDAAVRGDDENLEAAIRDRNGGNERGMSIQPLDTSTQLSSPGRPAWENARALALTCALLLILLSTAVASLGLVLLMEQEHRSPI